MVQLAALAFVAVLNVVIGNPVVDQAEVLLPAERARIADRVRALRQHTGVQLAVLTIRTTGGEPLADFSHRTANAWGGGRKGRDDGLLLTLAVIDRQVRLEVGSGLEARLPDAAVQRILDAATEELKQKRYPDAVLGILTRIEANLQSGTESPRSAAALGQAAPVVPPSYPLVVPFRADPVAPEPIPPLGPLVLAPLAGLILGYVLGAGRARARTDLADVFAFLILLGVGFVAFSHGLRDGRGKLLAVSLAGIGFASMLARSWGVTLLGWVVSAAAGGLAGAAAWLLQLVIEDQLTKTAAFFYKGLFYALGSSAAAQLVAAWLICAVLQRRSLWARERARDRSGIFSRHTGSVYSDWSSEDRRGDGSSGGGGGSGGSDWGGGGGGFGGGGADIKY